MRVLITGSREANAEMYQKAREVVNWCAQNDHQILVGDAPGIDHQARTVAAQLQVTITVYGAYGTIRESNIGKTWERRVKTPGTYPQRDAIMAQDCDLCVAIWNGRSRGTRITYEAAQRLGKRVILRTFT